LATARKNLEQVTLADHLLDLIADICLAYDVDGMRTDLVIHKTARTLAAWSGVEAVTADQVRKAAELALPHRQRRQPFEQSGLDPEPLDDLMNQHERNQREPESAPDLEDD
jgi:magnesium chelatase subunit D